MTSESLVGQRVSLVGFCNGTLMIFGTAVGAGMLGIPSMMAGVGFNSALIVTSLVWLFMAVTGLLLLEVTLKMPPGSNVISLSGRFLGEKGKWFAAALFLFLYYCLLVAYFSGGAPLLGKMFSLIGIALPPLLEKSAFLLFFGGVILLGMRYISRVNLVLTVGMFFSYAALLTFGSSAGGSQPSLPGQFSLAAGAVPVLFSAFGFHNIIPSLTTYLKGQKNVLRLSVITGTFLAFVFYLLWIRLVLSSVPIAAIEESKLLGVPVTYALQAVSGTASLYLWGQAFAFFALTSSFLGVGFSFVDFIRDGFNQRKKNVSRIFCCLCTLLPPFCCVLINPAVFEEALGIAGGFGESILNGLIPVALFWKMRTHFQKTSTYGLKALLLFLTVCSFFVICIEGYELIF